LLGSKLEVKRAPRLIVAVANGSIARLDESEAGVAACLAMDVFVETATAAGREERARVLRVLREHEGELRARPDPSCAVRLHRAR